MRYRLLVCAIALPVSALAAQSSTTQIARIGEEVRLSLSGNAVVRGILVRVADDTVFLALTKGSAPAILRNAVLQTEVRQRGSIGAGAARGAKIGFVVGLGVGIVGALTSSRCESGGQRVSCDSVPFGGLAEGLGALLIVVSPVLGAAAGGVVGTVAPPHDLAACGASVSSGHAWTGSGRDFSHTAQGPRRCRRP